MKNITAYTASSSGHIHYPEYISLNQNDDGELILSVRAPQKTDEEKGYIVAGDLVSVNIPHDQLKKITTDLNAFVAREQQTK